MVNKTPDAAAKQVASELFGYCRDRNWAGYDPYDGLNSRLFKALPFLDKKLSRLVLIQGLKRFPINLRPLLMVPPTQNPKGLALFLKACLKLEKLGVAGAEDAIPYLAAQIEKLRSPDGADWCWGYSFPCQTRTVLVPRWEPNAVCTIFAANDLLDYYEVGGVFRYLTMAVSAAEFILQLTWSGPQIVSLRYPLSTQESEIHNANLLGAALLCRVAKLSGERKFLEPAFRLARHSAAQSCPARH